MPGSSAFSQNDTMRANKYIGKVISILRKDSASEATIERAVGNTYAQAGLLPKASSHLKKALSFNALRIEDIRDIADTYIQNGINLNDVPGLMDNCMKLAKSRYDYYNCMDTKGRVY